MFRNNLIQTQVSPDKKHCWFWRYLKLKTYIETESENSVVLHQPKHLPHVTAKIRMGNGSRFVQKIQLVHIINKIEPFNWYEWNISLVT